MNRLIMTSWRGQTDWSAELESGVPTQPFTQAARPIDRLDENAAVHWPTPTFQGVESLNSGDDVGRYLPLGEEASSVGEAGSYLPVAVAFDLPLYSSAGSRLYDSALDEFFIEGRFGDSHPPGPFRGGSSELHLIDDVIATPATDVERLVDTFMALPHDDAFTLPLNDGMEAFGVHGQAATFGGGDDPHWMLTLFPSPDDHIHDTGFGHPGPVFDPWG